MKLDYNDFQTALFLHAPAACNKVERNLREIENTLNGQLATTATPTQCTCDMEVEWNSIYRRQIGYNRFQSANTFSYGLPNTVPNTAKEVLLFVTTKTAYSNPHEQQIFIKLYTEENGKSFEQHIFLITHRRTYDWSYSSDNMWFPITTNRRVYVDNHTPLSGSVYMRIYAIGYR